MQKGFVSCVAIASVILFSVSASSAIAKTPPPSSKAAAIQANKSEKKPDVESMIGNMLQISAAVPTDFDKTILVNFISTEKENVMARLDKLNGYIYEEDVKPGTYKVDFINVVGENATDYNIDFSEMVVVKEGSAVRFKIQLSLKQTVKPTIKPQEEPSENANLEPKEEGIERMLDDSESSRSRDSITEHGVQNSTDNSLSEVSFVKPNEKTQRKKYTIEIGRAHV